MGCGESRISHSTSAAGGVSRCDVDRVAQTDFVTVAAARAGLWACGGGLP